MAQDTKHFLNEADVGSGEKTAAQKDLEREQQSLNGSKAAEPMQQGKDNASADEDPTAGGKVLRSGDHIARILAVAQPDQTFEAQVYVRLAREPKVAETYIPAGIHGTEAEAWAAAEERAMRALKEREF
jgi:hypothetical protein